VYDISQTVLFRKWLRRVRDPVSRARLVRRIERLAAGKAGDQRFLGGGLYELREHTGPGYRIYFTFRSGRLILLLAGGDKSSQERDINLARSMIDRLEQDA
jgi:putative addiction module killer protein